MHLGDAAEAEAQSLDDRLRRLVQRRQAGRHRLESSPSEEAEPCPSQVGQAVQALKEYLELRAASLAPIHSSCAAAAEETPRPHHLSSEEVSPDGRPLSAQSPPDVQLDKQQASCQPADASASLSGLSPDAQELLVGDLRICTTDAQAEPQVEEELLLLREAQVRSVQCVCIIATSFVRPASARHARRHRPADPSWTACCCGRQRPPSRGSACGWSMRQSCGACSCCMRNITWQLVSA